jgi:hypothetical protein
VGQKIKNTLCGVFYFYIQRKKGFKPLLWG